MKKYTRRFFTPEEKSKELEVVMREVRRKVEIYRKAKKAGTLRKITSLDCGSLFNV